MIKYNWYAQLDLVNNMGTNMLLLVEIEAGCSFLLEHLVVISD